MMVFRFGWFLVIISGNLILFVCCLMWCFVICLLLR